MRNDLLPSFLFLVALCTPVELSAQELLKPIGLLHRCYTQLTSSYLNPNSDWAAKVKAGQLDAIEVCIQILKNSEFTQASGTQSDGSSEARSVLRTMHAIHHSWFRSKEYHPSWTYVTSDGAADLIDITTPAMFITAALFRPSSQASQIFQGRYGLRAIRTNMDPTIGPFSQLGKSGYAMTNFKFAPVGELLGIENWTDAQINYTGYLGPFFGAQSGPLDLASSMGGGVIGSSSYILQNVKENADFISNGVRLPRKWGRSIVEDFLCRELPIVRRADATPFVVPTSSIPYRTSVACTQCHVSMDRAAATLRNFRHLWTGSGAADVTGRGIEFYELHAVDPATSDTDVFPSAIVPNYYASTPKGVLYFRNYKGDLIDISVDSIDELGNAIAKQDDPYICLAKRYYQYFMGIDIRLGDPEDPDRPIVRNAIEGLHYDRVIALGLELKKSGSISKLIEGILKTDSYRWSDFQARGSGN